MRGSEKASVRLWEYRIIARPYFSKQKGSFVPKKITTFGKLVARLLKESKLTAAELARLAGISESQISLIISGERELRARTLAKILKGAGKPWGWLDENFQLK